MMCMRNYKVAIIIPTLNEERFIENCLTSVMKQTFPFEEMDVMVVDGGSKDKTREIVQRISEQHPTVRLIDNPGRIQSIAFNIGVKASSAPYVVRLDAHATYNKVYIEKCLEIFSVKAHVLGCSPELLGNVGGVWNIRPQHSQLIQGRSQESLLLPRKSLNIFLYTPYYKLHAHLIAQYKAHQNS